MVELLVFVIAALYFLNMARLAQGKHVAIKIPIALLYTGFCFAIYALTGIIIAFRITTIFQGNPLNPTATITSTIVAYATLVPTVLLGRKLFRKLNYEEGKAIPTTHGG